MNTIERLLREEIGLDAAVIGNSVLDRTVRRRLKLLGLNQLEEYLRRLKNSPTELEELIESVVVKETWFFRDREPFHAFARIAREWLSQHPTGTLRALSLPCATGEEPYSMVMALLDAQVPPHRFEIDAADISTDALARAREAVYRKNSFRGDDLSFRKRYFQSTHAGYALHSEVRERVRFHHANLLGEAFMHRRSLYDIVFSRNLLIYFDRAAQAKALAQLAGLLTPHGWLFVGPAEIPLATANGFVGANWPMAFACRRASPPAAINHGDHGQRLPVTSINPSRMDSPAQLTIEPGDSPTPPSAVHAVAEELSDLEVARQLADAGRLDESVALCEAHLRQRGPAAEAYFLLGLVGEARGEAQAINYYRKALYLEPNHYETLRHIALLLEKNGDPNAAQTFRRRAERLQPAAIGAGQPK